MKQIELEKVLQILDFVLKHPISFQFHNGALDDDVYSLVKLREQIENNIFSTPAEAVKKIYDVIDLNGEEESFLVLLGNEVKRLISKKVDLLFSSKKDWGLRVAKLRSKLADLTANPPTSIKTVCQWSSRPYIQKPEINFYSEAELKRISEKLNRYLADDSNGERLMIIREIIKENEHELKGEGEINIAELGFKTLELLQQQID